MCTNNQQADSIKRSVQSSKHIVDTKDTNPADEVMCGCSGTTRENIQSLFEQGLDMDAISRRTGAISGCGACEWDIAQFLSKLAGE